MGSSGRFRGAGLAALGWKIAKQEPREVPVALARRAGSGAGIQGGKDHGLGPCYPAPIAPPWATGGADEHLPSTERIHRWPR